MQVGQFPASAANSLIQGYCDDFVSLAAILAQTLEQVSMRGIPIAGSRPALERIENGMRDLAAAIHDLLERGAPTSDRSRATGKDTNPQPGPSSPQPAQPGAQPSLQPSKVATEPNAGPAPAPGPSKGATPVAAGAKVQATGSSSVSAGEPSATATKGAAPRNAAATVTAVAPPLATATAASASPPTTASTASASPTGAIPAREAARVGTATHGPSTHGPSTHGPGTHGPSPTFAPPARPRPRGTADGLRGTAQSMPLLSVLQFIGRMRKQGTMQVETGGERLVFEIENGCIVAATTDRCRREETLAELLIERGHCTRELIVALAEKVDGNSDRLGQLALDEGLLTMAQLADTMESQARRRMTRCCKCPDASYVFHEGQTLATTAGHLRIQPIAIS